MPSGFGSWWPSLSRGPKELWDRQAQEVEGGWVVMQNYQRWVLMRRTFHPAPGRGGDDRVLGEPLQRPVNGDLAFTPPRGLRVGRPRRALGRFEDLLLAVATHPAMLIYLDGRPVDEGAPQREPRPRAAGAAHRRRAARTARTTSRRPHASSPAGGSTCSGPGRRATAPRRTPPVRCGSWTSPTTTPRPTAAT